MHAFILAAVLTTASQLSEALIEERLGERFELEGLVTLTTGQHASLFPLVTTNGNVSIFKKYTPELYPLAPDFPQAGDIVQAKGVITTNRLGLPIPECTDIQRIAQTTPPKPVTATAEDIHSGKVNCLAITTEGIVQDIFKDEIDPNWIYITLNSDGIPLYVVMPDNGIGLKGVSHLNGCTVSALGVCHAFNDGCRRMMEKSLFVAGPDSIAIVRQGPKDPFAVPSIPNEVATSPSDLAKTGNRKIIGKVTACWGIGQALLLDATGKPHRLSFHEAPYPEYGDVIEAVGRPETDLYRINLTAAIWRKTSVEITLDDSPTETRASEILSDLNGNRRINPRFHGKRIRLHGKVIDTHDHGNGLCTITIKDDGFTLPIEIPHANETCSGISAGYEITACGTCIVETENWKPYTAFPHATGITLVVNDSKDILIRSRPPWWTARRLCGLVIILFASLFVFFIWNAVLRLIITRKSRQLLREQIAQVKATLRVDERTQLAVELHDTLAQNLSGVACQIAATKSMLPSGATEAAQFLETAESMLLSCRTELRRCLWDLRSDALEETLFADALRKTLAPVSLGATLTIRFDVLRTRLSDTTAHAVLCIIRELVANAIRHGKAKEILIDGLYQEGCLVFEIRDNGCGFDPSHCPGPAEGHFGLEGIRERIKRMDGTFEIASKPGDGTHVKVVIRSITPSNEEDIRR